MWTQLIDDVLKAGEVPGDVAGDALTPEALARLAAEFARLDKDRFQGATPTNVPSWERMQRELIAVNIPAEARPRFAIVIGACWGEFLHRKHGAVWQLGTGPLTQPVPPITSQNGPFAVQVNPFRPSLLSDPQPELTPQWLNQTLSEAEGRTLVLTNGPAAGAAGVKAQVDPDLEKAIDLFQEEKPNEAERLILNLVSRKQHEQNRRLLAQVGKLLYENQRLDALQQMLMPRMKTLPPDARLHNLMGLALLDTDPTAAATQFRDALRCDLAFEAALLNLAVAYEKAGERESAKLCLRRYQKLWPQRANIPDIRQRLGALMAAPNSQ